MPLPAICKSLLSLLQFYYFLNNYEALPCSKQSPAHKYCTSNYKHARRRAQPNKMGRSQAAYDSPRQKLARSPRGRPSDAAKHDTAELFFFYFSFFFFASWQPQRSSSSTGSEAAIAARMKSSGLQLRLPLRFLLSLVQSAFSSSVFPLCRPFSLLPSVSFLSPPTLSCPFSQPLYC